MTPRNTPAPHPHEQGEAMPPFDPEQEADARREKAERMPNRREMVEAAFVRRLPQYQETVRKTHEEIATWSKDALESLNDLSSLHPPEKSSIKSIIQRLGRLSPTMMTDSLHGMQQELDTFSLGLSRFPAESPEQTLIADVREKIQRAIDANPVAETIYKGQHPDKKYDTSSATGSLRMIGTLAAAGIAILSGFMDLKRGKPSVSTLAYGALAFLGAGGFQSRYTSEVQFLTDPNYKRFAKSLGIPPNNLANLADNLWGAGAAKIRELKNIDTKFKGTEEEKQEKIRELIGELEPALLRSGARREDILAFAEIVQDVRSGDARKVALTLIDPEGHPAD